MEHAIKRVAVLGAGTMGAAIAAHVANAGLPVLLLDIAPKELDPKEEKKGLSLESPAVRNRIVRQGLERCRKLKPASFMGQQAQQLVDIGNFEDDLHRLAEVDWIIEVVVENLALKRQLLAKVEEHRRPGTLVTTNTSGLPIASIAEGRSEDFRQHFFGTHFFNPPRYMRLVEIIRGNEADPIKVSALAEFIIKQLGKGIVFCKDTPNFIANRLASIHGVFGMEYALQKGIRFEEVDALTGPLIGRPKTASFRLQDLVGIDIAWHVAQNLYESIPKDPYTEVLRAPHSTRLIEGLLDRGWLGKKSGQGFYRKVKGKGGKSVFEVLNPKTFEYEAQQEVKLESLKAVGKIKDLGERLQALFSDDLKDDRGSQHTWAILGHFLGYAADVAQEISYDIVSLDRAIRWGFGYEVGPFQLWDKLGVAATADRMEASGIEVEEWVKEMLFAEIDSFYRIEDGWVTGVYDWTSQSYTDLLYDEHHIRVEDLHKSAKPLAQNRSASLHDLGDGVLLLEFHSKMNAIDGDLITMMRTALTHLESDAYYGLVIGNDGPNFSVGANLKFVGQAALAGDLDSIRAGTQELQEALQAFRYASKPVVAAVHGMALGGGAEIALGVSRIVAHAESYIGLVEVGVGLVPAGGGLKELVRRVVGPVAENSQGDPLAAANRLLETVAMAKVSSSATEALEMGFLGPRDRIIMHRDHLLFEAKQEVLAMMSDGYLPPPPARIWAGGRDLFAALKIAVWSLVQAGWASEHDALVAEKVAWVLAGGDLSTPQWVDESYFLELESEAFIELVGTEKTQARIRHMLETGKPLRN
jgi:3-hydroxyacyl-CoA dehydrogenase